MALDRKNILDREYNKFVESPTRPGEPAIEIAGTFTADVAPGPFSPPSNCDFISRAVASNVETYVYKNGGASGATLKTVTVTYVLDDLEDILTVEVV